MPRDGQAGTESDRCRGLPRGGGATILGLVSTFAERILTPESPRATSRWIAHLRYEIIFAPEAEEDLLVLQAYDRAKVLDAIEMHLRFAPEEVSKSRIKRLRDLEWPRYRLRVDDIRVFYDVLYTIEGGVVEVLVIKDKASAMRWLAERGRKII